jgi:hypothetical protein
MVTLMVTPVVTREEGVEPPQGPLPDAERLSGMREAKLKLPTPRDR